VVSAPASTAAPAMKVATSAMPRPAVAASRIMSPLLTRRPTWARTIAVLFGPEKRQSAAPRFV
jgi:hypothetical protein